MDDTMIYPQYLYTYGMSQPECRGKVMDIAARSYHAITFRLAGRVTLEGEGFNLVSTPGTVTYMPAGVAYRTVVTENDMKIIQFVSNVALSDRPFVWTPDDPAKVQSLFDAIGRTRSVPYGINLPCAVPFYRLLRMIYESNNSSSAPDWLKSARGELLANLSNSDFRVTQLATRSGVSEAYFRRVFQREYGLSPKSFLLTQRLTEAARLLSTGYYSVAEIAQRCGFDDPSHFSSSFSKHYGCSPRKYAEAELRIDE